MDGHGRARANRILVCILASLAFQPVRSVKIMAAKSRSKTCKMTVSRRRIQISGTQLAAVAVGRDIVVLSFVVPGVVGASSAQRLAAVSLLVARSATVVVLFLWLFTCFVVRCCVLMGAGKSPI